MWKNYLTVAVRNLHRHPIYSGINIIGLALSMAVGLLVVAFIWHQFQYDQFHDNKDRIVRLISEWDGERRATLAAAPGPMADELEETAPEVEETVRLSRLVGTLTENNNALQIEGLFAEESFFDVFDFKLAKGNPQTALSNPRSLILTENTATKLFGDASAMGKTVPVERAGGDISTVFTVTGVLEKPPGPSHLVFEALASFSTLHTLAGERNALQAWDNLSKYPTYVLLREGTSSGDLADNFASLIESRYPYGNLAPDEISFRAQELTNINPGPFYGSQVRMHMVPLVVIYSLVGVGAILLLVACFNYVGLSISRSLDRTTEIGVRKAIGARRAQVAGQFMTEAVLFALLALIGAYALLRYLMPTFNNLQFVREENWQITSSIYDPGLLVTCILFSIGVGLLAGCYPALRLSSLQPTQIMRGGLRKDFRGLDKLSLRRILVVVQFALALIFTISGVQLTRQYNYISDYNFGMDIEHIVNIRLQDESYATIRQELLQYPSIEAVSASGGLPPRGWTRTTRLTSSRLTDTLSAMMNVVDPYFVGNMGLRLVAGENFSSGLDRKMVQSAIINETAARQLGFEAPQEAVGRIISSGYREPDRVKVLGVVQDFQYEDLTTPIRPLVLRYEPDQFWYVNVRTVPGLYEEAQTAIEKTWKKLNSPYPVQYERYETRIAQDDMTMFFHDLAQVIGFIAVLIIVVAGMGLLGMSAFATQTRAKEIGIRKVLGASVRDIVVLLSWEFFVLVSIAIAIALPIAWYANTLWLQEFARRIDMSGWVMAWSVVSVLAIALLTVGSQTLKAALANPVDVIRYG